MRARSRPRGVRWRRPYALGSLVQRRAGLRPAGVDGLAWWRRARACALPPGPRALAMHLLLPDPVVVVTLLAHESTVSFLHCKQFPQVSSSQALPAGSYLYDASCKLPLQAVTSTPKAHHHSMSSFGFLSCKLNSIESIKYT